MRKKCLLILNALLNIGILSKTQYIGRIYFRNVYGPWYLNYGLYIVFQTCFILFVNYFFSKLAREKFLKYNRDSAKILFIFSIIFLSVYLINWDIYKCRNVDLMVHMSIIKRNMGEDILPYAEYCPRLQDFDNEDYLEGYFNGTYQTRIHKLIGEISLILGVDSNTLFIIVGILSLFLNISMLYFIIKTITKDVFLHLSIILWGVYSPKFIAINGWFSQSLLSNVIFLSILILIYLKKNYKKDKWKEYLIISILWFSLAILFSQYMFYNLNYLLTAPDRLFNNDIDKYRMIYTLSMLVSVFISEFALRLFIRIIICIRRIFIIPVNSRN